MTTLSADGHSAQATGAGPVSANDTDRHADNRIQRVQDAWEKAVRRWAERLKLHSWHITCRVSEEETGGEFAVTHVNSETYDAVSVLNPAYESATWPRTLDDIACHEMLHLVIAQIMWPIKDAVGTGMPTPHVPGHDMAHVTGRLWDRCEETLVDYLAYRMTELASQRHGPARDKALKPRHNGRVADIPGAGA